MSYIVGQLGVGDGVYQLPALAGDSEIVYLETTTPWLYHHLEHVRCVEHREARNDAHSPAVRSALGRYEFHPAPEGVVATWARSITRDDLDARPDRAIAWARLAGRRVVHRPEPILPIDPAWITPRVKQLIAGGPFGVLRPSTIREEWSCESRNPQSGALATAVEQARRCGLRRWIAAGAVLGDREHLSDPVPECVYERLLDGELTLEEVAALLVHAELIVTPVCYVLPLAQALGLGPRTVALFGGYIPPDRIVTRLLGDPPASVVPSPFCSCYVVNHACEKSLSVSAIRNAVDSCRSLRVG